MISYRNELEDAGVKGVRAEVDDEDVQGNIPDKYYRILKSLDVVKEKK